MKKKNPANHKGEGALLSWVRARAQQQSISHFVQTPMVNLQQVLSVCSILPSLVNFTMITITA